MSIGNQISNLRKEQQLTQEKFAELFHVTRQTVSNWENGKSYPDLQTLIKISDSFNISLDTLLKEDAKMVKAIDKERLIGTIKREKAVSDFFSGIGTGIIASCLNFPESTKRFVIIILGFLVLGIGWYARSKYDERILSYMEEQDNQ